MRLCKIPHNNLHSHQRPVCSVSPCFRSLELRYPREVDIAVNAALQDPSYTTRFSAARQGTASALPLANGHASALMPAAPMANGVAHGSDEDDSDDEAAAAAPQSVAEAAAGSLMFDFIQETFQATASAPADKNAGQTLAAALDAPAAAMRSAVRHVSVCVRVRLC